MAEYACATREEMRQFIQNLKVTTMLERITDFTDRDGTTRKKANLVVRFTPFPVKYLNYIKSHQDKHKGREHRTNNNVVYIQLFKLSHRCKCATVGAGVPAFFNRVGWGYSSYADATFSALCGPRISPCYHYSNRYVYRQRYPLFKYALSPTDAARGYMIMLRDVTLYDWESLDGSQWHSALDNCTLRFGQLLDSDNAVNNWGHFSFGKAVIGGVVFGDVMNTGKECGVLPLTPCRIAYWMSSGCFSSNAIFEEQN